MADSHSDRVFTQLLLAFVWVMGTLFAAYPCYILMTDHSLELGGTFTMLWALIASFLSFVFCLTCFHFFSEGLSLFSRTWWIGLILIFMGTVLPLIVTIAASQIR